MKTKILFKTLLLFFCTIGMISCNEEDDGSRGFMHTAIIIGDSTNGYYCYTDGKELIIPQNQNLDGIERGYFSISYMEEDWTITPEKQVHINNAFVYPVVVYDIIHPISIEKAESKNSIDPDSCTEPPYLSFHYVNYGYLDINTGLAVVNGIDLEKNPAKINIVYDPAQQNPDTLFLQLYYNLQTPEKWTNTHIEYGDISCDISSLANLIQWNDSITISIETTDEKKHTTKISKNDFFKPEKK